MQGNIHIIICDFTKAHLTSLHCELVRGTPVFHMSESFHDDPKGCEGDQKFSHPA